MSVQICEQQQADADHGPDADAGYADSSTVCCGHEGRREYGYRCHSEYGLVMTGWSNADICLNSDVDTADWEK